MVDVAVAQIRSGHSAGWAWRQTIEERAQAVEALNDLLFSLATFIAGNRFSADEHEAGKAAAVLGISFITEGAIPFAAKDPFWVIPACIAGSAVAGGLSMLFNCTLWASHGGVFVLAISNAVSHLLLYIVAIAARTVVTALLLRQLKKPIVEA